MKMKLVSALFAFSLCATASFAQKGVEDGSRFGHGQDSLNCLKNISIYTEYVKTNNFQDAYTPWKAVFDEAPLAQVGTYTNGAKILRALIASAKDGATQKKYLEELIKVHDQRIKYLDGLNTLVKRPTTVASITATKAHDVYTMGGDNKTAYDLFKFAVEGEKAESDYYILMEFVESSSKIVKDNDSHKEQFVQDYLAASSYADEAYKAATKDKDKTNYKTAKDNIDAYFINSGVATCENLNTIYGPKVEQNKTNLDYLKQVINVMQLLRCTEEEAYFAASEAAHAIEPTAQTALGCGYMYYKKGDIDKFQTYFDDAINLEQDPETKADYAYRASLVFYSKKMWGKAKEYAKKAISINENNGNAYLTLAKIYAANTNWSDEAALNKCSYFAVIDKCQKAKSVDPSVTEEANTLIGQYSRYTPKAEDLFFIGLQKGQAVSIGGIIGETTTIR